MTSESIKVAALCWLRFGRRYPYVCTEGGHWNADVIGGSSKVLVEIETKISKSDFRADFVKNKHDFFATKATPQYRGASWIPNQFYFAVPKELEQFALEYLKSSTVAGMNPERNALLAPNVAKYGLLVCDEGSNYQLTCVKTAGKIHAVPPSPKVLENMLLRMGSELTNFHIYSHRYNTWLHDMKDEARRLSGAVDIDPECAIIGEGEPPNETIPG